MKRLFAIIIIFVFPCISFASQKQVKDVLQQWGGGTACTAGTSVATQNEIGDVYGLTSSAAYGNSFVVSESGYIRSVVVRFSTAPAAGTFTVRWGTTQDLTSSSVAESSIVNPTIGNNEFVFNNKVTANTGTTYYFGITTTSSGNIVRKIS